MDEHEYWEQPFLRQWRKKSPQNVVEATADDVRGHYENLGYEVRIAEDAQVEIRKPTRAWRDVGYVDEYLNLHGEAAEWNRRRKLINTIKQRRYRRSKQHGQQT